MVYIHTLEYHNFQCTYNSVDCQWNDWIVGVCSTTCGGGIRTNTRIERVSAAYGGEACNGLNSIHESCNDQDCPGRFCTK